MPGINYDVQLTNFAHGIAPDYSSRLAEIMAPQCVAPAAIGHYVAFDDADSFRYLDTKRTLGGKGVRIELNTSARKFSCDPHAIEIPTDVFEQERVGEAGMTMLRESKIRTLVSRNALSREKRVYDAYANNVSAIGGVGGWTDSTAQPIDELNAVITDLMIQTGQRNVELVVALDALRQIAKHPNVKSQLAHSNIINFSGTVLEQMLMVPVKVHVGMMPIATEKAPKAATKGIIGSGKIYALISQANPSPFDPSAAKTFTTKAGQVDGVGFYQELPYAEINFMSWSEDIQITGAACVKRIDVSLGAIS